MPKVCFLIPFFIITITGTAQNFAFDYKGQQRSFLLHLPHGFDSTKTYPLVLNFHGLLSDPQEQRRLSQMDTVADQEGFIVVYPKGKRFSWNNRLGTLFFNGGRDDVGFVNALLDTLIKHLPINTNRVYATGMSMGGFFTYRLACQLEGRFAAIASVTGLMSGNVAVCCETAASIPVLQIHGTRDRLVPYRGNKRTLSAEEVTGFWTTKNGCRVTDTIPIPDTCDIDKSSAVLIRHRECSTGSEVWLYQVHKGGHTWPGAPESLIFHGRVNQDLHGSHLIWDFFERFSLEDRKGVETVVDQ